MAGSRSKHYDSLEDSVKRRYDEKCTLTRGRDPYLIPDSDFTCDPQEFPSLCYYDIVNYLVFKKCAYSEKDFRAIKSLQAYDAYKSGWLKKLVALKMDQCILVSSRVMHSQRLSLPPTKTWVLCQEDGAVIAAHCDCVAGLGECCSHVGTTLFGIEGVVKKREDLSVTDVPAYWMVPSQQLGASSAVDDINYGDDESGELYISPNINIPRCSFQEGISLLEDLSKLNKATVLLRCVPPFNDEIAAEVSESRKNKSFLHIRDKKYESYTHEELVHIANGVVLPLFEPNVVEVETRDQSCNPLWFVYREGRITASIFKSVCTSKLLHPSLSLIKRICYPKHIHFQSKATSYGCTHEKDALAVLEESQSAKHIGFKLKSSGLIINNNYPMFGASPDGIATCECPTDSRDSSEPHGKWVVEVKCPYCAKDAPLAEIIELKKFYLQKDTAGGVKLKKDHMYYFQVQMQMALMESQYCHFVVWSKSDFIIEKIQFDPLFWKQFSEKATIFHKVVIIPELLGRLWTRNKE